MGYAPNPATGATGDGGETGIESGGPQRGTNSDTADLPLPESAFRRAAGRDAIPAIVDPSFGSDWFEVAIDFGDGVTYLPELADDDLVLGVEREAVAEGDAVGATRASSVRTARCGR